MKTIAKLALIPGAVLLSCCIGIANAADRGPIDQDFQLSVGGFFMETDTRLRLDGQTTQTGTEVEWESEFGLGDENKIAATWSPARNVGIGVAYNTFVTRLKVEKNDFTGRLRIGYGGPMAFVTVGF